MNCRGYNAYGRRRREVDRQNTTAVEVAESLNEGQLREEITIQSNAILTFERREERFVDPTEGKKFFSYLWRNECYLNIYTLRDVMNF